MQIQERVKQAAKAPATIAGNRASRRKKSSGAWSRHSIFNAKKEVIDHFTKQSSFLRKELSRKKEKARRQARKANW